MAKGQQIMEGTLKHDRLLRPEDLLHFVELDEFSDDWKTLKLSDDDLCALQVGLMASPKGGSVMKGTGGLRKMRFAPATGGRGKRGFARVCYVYFEKHFVVLLVMAYSKNDPIELDATDRKAIAAYIREVDDWLSKRRYN